MPKSTISAKDKILARKEELKAKPPVEPAPEECLQLETFQAAKLETPDLMASMMNLQSELKLRTEERDSFKTKLDRVTFLMDALKRSYGLSPAAHILETPCEPPRASVVEQFNSLTDEVAKGMFYAEHKEELLRHINRGVPDRDVIPDTYR